MRNFQTFKNILLNKIPEIWKLLIFLRAIFIDKKFLAKIFSETGSLRDIDISILLSIFDISSTWRSADGCDWGTASSQLDDVSRSFCRNFTFEIEFSIVEKWLRAKRNSRVWQNILTVKPCLVGRTWVT